MTASGHQETISSAPGKVGNQISKQPFESRAEELAISSVAGALLHSPRMRSHLFNQGMIVQGAWLPPRWAIKEQGARSLAR